jgi:hypothetical protein
MSKQVVANPQPSPTPGPNPPVQGPTPKKYAGKYDSIEAFEKGYGESQTEANRIVQENQLLKERLAIADEQARVAAQQTQNPIRRESPSDNYAKLKEQLADDGLPVDIIEKMIDARSKEQAAMMVGEGLAPLAGALEAQEVMTTTYPDYADNAAAINQYLNDNPTVKARYEQKRQQVGAAEATEFAYLSYQAHAAKQGPSKRTVDGAAAQAQARIDGQNNAAGGGPTLNPALPDGDYAEQLAAAYEKGQKGGTQSAWKDYFNLRLKGITDRQAPLNP